MNKFNIHDEKLKNYKNLICFFILNLFLLNLVQGLKEVPQKTCYFSSYNEEIIICRKLISPNDKVSIITNGKEIICDNDLNCLQGLKNIGSRVVITSMIKKPKDDGQTTNKEIIINPVNMENTEIENKGVVKDGGDKDSCGFFEGNYKSLNVGIYVLLGEYKHNVNPQGIYEQVGNWEKIIKTKEVDVPFIRKFHYDIFKIDNDCCSIKLHGKSYYFSTKLKDGKWRISYFRDLKCLSGGHHIIERTFRNDKLAEAEDQSKIFKLMDVFTSSLETVNGVADDNFMYGALVFKVINSKTPDPNGKGTLYVTIYDYTDESRNKVNCDRYVSYEKDMNFGNEKWSLVSGECPEITNRIRLSPMKNIINEHTSCLHYQNMCLIYIDNGENIIFRDKTGDVVSSGLIENKSTNENMFAGYSTISSRNTVGNKFAILVFKILDYKPYQNSDAFNSWIKLFIKID